MDFLPGQAGLDSTARERLNRVSQILLEKPDLQIEIEGIFDPDSDREGYRRQLFNNKLRTAKFKELLRNKSTVSSLDSVLVEDSEYEKYLKQAYDQESFAKPRNWLGLERSLSSAEMEKLLWEQLTVKEEDLKVLASARAIAVKEYLINQKKVEPARVFLIESRSGEQKKGKGAPRSAELHLKAD